MRRHSCAVIVVVALALAGCARADVPTTPATSAPQSATTVAIESMPVEEKSSRIAESFPVEVPVPAGEVRRGEAQGSDAWDYEVLVEAPLQALDQWYQQAYAGRDWQLGKRTEAGGRVSLTFVKGLAQSQVVLEREGDFTAAVVILGVGAPVLQTQ